MKFFNLSFGKRCTNDFHGDHRDKRNRPAGKPRPASGPKADDDPIKLAISNSPLKKSI